MDKPTIDDFKDHFYRDFPFDTTASSGPFDPVTPDLTKVQDRDITKAFTEADVLFNESLFTDQNSFTLGYLYLSAHYLVMDLRASSQGIAGQFSWLQTSKGVGSVNEGIAIPQRILDNPLMAMLSKTNYGAKYLSLVLPQLCGQVFAIGGATQA